MYRTFHDAAEKYIYEKFADCYFSKETKEILHEVEEFKRFANHRSLTSPELHQTQTQEKRNELLKQFPFINIT